MTTEETENCIYVTLPYEEGKVYIGKNYDIEDMSFIIEGKEHHVLDAVVSDNDESVTLICVVIWQKKQRQ